MGEPWVGKLINEYTITKHALEAYRDRLRLGDPADKDEMATVGRIIADLQHSITWMRTGREPGSRRGADRRAVYQQTVVLDSELFPSLQIDPQDDGLTEEDKRRITDVLLTLTDRERQVYILHAAYGLSLKQIGLELGISKSTVQAILRRANKKIDVARV